MSKAVFHAQYTGLCKIHICFNLHNLAGDILKMCHKICFCLVCVLATVQSITLYLILALVRLLQTLEPLIQAQLQSYTWLAEPI